MPANLSAMTWWEYVGHTAPGESQEAIARRIGVSAPTVTRWRTSSPKPASVAAFARAYGRPVLEAFIAAGFLTPEDARAQVTITRHEDPSDDELLELLRRRLERDRQERETRGDTAPMNERDRTVLRLVDELGEDVTVGELRTTAKAVAHEEGNRATLDPRAHAAFGLAARQTSRDNPKGGGTTADG